LSAAESYLWWLYNACKKYNKLPEEKGIQEQRWDVITIFGAIDSAVFSAQKQKTKRQ
jgi:hypothetical protein